MLHPKIGHIPMHSTYESERDQTYAKRAQNP